MSASETVAITRTLPMPGEQPAPDIVVPRRIGTVTLTRELGRGGMGVVWLGRDEMLDRDVAVKFMLAAVSSPDDPRFSTFLAGAQAAAAVRHPNLTSMLNAGLIEESGGIPYLVMEYIDGPSASQLIASRGPLSLGAALTVIEGACLATAELHAKEIVHRDLKPGNIMLSTAGGIFVTDFGLALPRRSGAARVGIAGSPPYMAPEMFAGEVSFKTDVYALGVTLHELLTADLPFAGTFDDLERLHLHAPLPREKLDAGKVPAELIEVIERAMHKNALFRYRSAEHLRSAIRQACPRPDQWSRGCIDLATLVGAAPPLAVTAAPTGESTPAVSYYDTIGSRAAQRRHELESTRVELDAQRQQQEERCRDEERRVSEAILRRREESRGRALAETGIPSTGSTSPLPQTPTSPGTAAARSAFPDSKWAGNLSRDDLTSGSFCEQCGYSLRGIHSETPDNLCPECGARFDPAIPWRPSQWPTLPYLGLRLCGPMLAEGVLFVALAAVPEIRRFGVWPLLLVWAILFVIVAVVVPISGGTRLAACCLPMVERAPAVRRTATLAIAANVVIGFVTLICFALVVF